MAEWRARDYGLPSYVKRNRELNTLTVDRMTNEDGDKQKACE